MLSQVHKVLSVCEMIPDYSKVVQFVFKGMIATLVYTGLHKLLTKYLVFITIIAQAKVKKKKD